MATTAAEAQAYLTALKAAYVAVISGNEYTITISGTTRRLKRNDIGTIRKEMEHWEQYAAALEAGRKGMTVKFGTPHK